MSRFVFGLSALFFLVSASAVAGASKQVKPSPLPSIAIAPASAAATSSGPSALNLFIELVKKPTAEKLTKFKSRCVGAGTAAAPIEGGSIDFDGNRDANKMLTEIQGHGDLLPARAAVHAALHCTDGASAERLHSWLGNELLVRHPRTLVRALEAENAADRLASVVELENSDWDAVDCGGNARCERDRKELFGRKRKALQFPKATPAEEVVRQKLLSALKSDR